MPEQSVRKHRSNMSKTYSERECGRLSALSKPHSEVTSSGHTPALKVFSKRRSAVFWFCSSMKVSPENTDFEKRKCSFTLSATGWQLCFAVEAPFAFYLENPEFSVGDCRPDEHRKPQIISRAFRGGRGCGGGDLE